VKPGDLYRVKATSLLRRYGVTVYGSISDAHADCKAWPLEVGTVEDRTYTDSNGERVPCLRLTFSRGRGLAIPSDPERLAEFKRDFVKVRATPRARDTGQFRKPGACPECGTPGPHAERSCALCGSELPTR